MSRKSDIETAWQVHQGESSPFSASMYRVVQVAYDLGRAAQAEKDAKWMTAGVKWRAYNVAKRLRARVRTLTGDTK